MKKLIVLSIVTLLSCVVAVAQESAICGDWSGVFTSGVIDTDGERHVFDAAFKRHIRIKLINGNYIIRMKTRIADDSEPFIYWPECHIIEASDKMIKWRMNLDSDYSWSSDARHKGVRIGHADYYKYCTVKLSNGVLKYSEYLHTIYFDKQGRVIDSENNFEKSSQTLYKEDADW